VVTADLTEHLLQELAAAIDDVRCTVETLGNVDHSEHLDDLDNRVHVRDGGHRTKAIYCADLSGLLSSSKIDIRANLPLDFEIPESRDLSGGKDEVPNLDRGMEPITDHQRRRLKINIT
jgi:hypothetical protein